MTIIFTYLYWCDSLHVLSDGVYSYRCIYNLVAWAFLVAVLLMGHLVRPELGDWQRTKKSHAILISIKTYFLTPNLGLIGT